MKGSDKGVPGGGQHYLGFVLSLPSRINWIRRHEHGRMDIIKFVEYGSNWLNTVRQTAISVIKLLNELA